MSRPRWAVAATAAVLLLVIGCAPLEGRHLDDRQVTDLEHLVDSTSELVDQTERDVASEPP